MSDELKKPIPMPATLMTIIQGMFGFHLLRAKRMMKVVDPYTTEEEFAFGTCMS